MEWHEPAICAAIGGLLLLEFDYGGLSRTVQPYVHGVTHAGQESLRAIQVEGHSRSGGFGFGKVWTLAKMSRLHVTRRLFLPDDPNYNPDDSAFGHIHCRVEPVSRR